MQTPIAKKIPLIHNNHQIIREDNYAWLRNKDTDPDVLRYLEEENAYTQQYMDSTLDLQETLFQEITGRIQLADTSVPFLLHDYWYFYETGVESEYKIFCRKHKDSTQSEILHDQNICAKDKPFYQVGDYDISLDSKQLAWTEDNTGDEYYSLFVKNLETGEIKQPITHKIADAVVWSSDNRTLFYLRYDATHRPNSVWVHDLLDPLKEDYCLFMEPDERFWVGIWRSKTDKFVMIDLSSKETTETHLINLSDKTLTPRVVFPRKNKIRYAVCDLNDDLYVLTNEGAKNFRLMKTDLYHPDKSHWQEIIPHSKEITLESLEPFSKYLVITQREKAQKRLRILSLESADITDIEFDEPCYDISCVDNHMFDSDTLRFSYTSLKTPNQIYDYCFSGKTKTLLKQTAVLGNFDVSQYVTLRLNAKSEDGTDIPISLVYKKDLSRDTPAPLYLYGYGAYGISLDPWFSHARLSLLDRGFIFAIAHVRGGGDCGELWHEAGKLHEKYHTFDDFIACAQFLITQQYTTPSQLVISGGSAGGLLIGAVLNKRPDLFAAAIADVPFVDCLNTMLDPTLPLTVHEYEEWGNPQELSAFQDIAAYSPYEQVKAQDYPALLITAGLYDPRVSYWEPAKWCAKLRELKTDNHILLLKTDVTSGHGGPSGRFNAFREVTFEYAFVLKTIGE